MEPSIIIIGIGNEYRGDDAAGLAVIQALKTQDLPPRRLIEGMSDGMSLLACWDVDSKVILVDAVSSGAEVGTIYRFDALAQPIPASLSFCSTHAFGVAEALTLAHTLQQLPSTLIMYALEGKNYASGAALSPEVEHTVQKVVAQVEQEVSSWTDPAHGLRNEIAANKRYRTKQLHMPSRFHRLLVDKGGGVLLSCGNHEWKKRRLRATSCDEYISLCNPWEEPRNFNI